MIKCKTVMLLCSLLFCNTTIKSQIKTKLDYANYLYTQKDFYRAITCYKELYYYSQGEAEKQQYLENIYKSYYNSKYYKTSIDYIKKLHEYNNIATEIYEKSVLFLGLNYYMLNGIPKANSCFNKILSPENANKALFYSTLIDIEYHKWATVTEKFNLLSKTEDSGIKTISHRLYTLAKQNDNVAKKKLLTAGLLSAIIPGSGQIYSEHYYDGIQAFIYVAATGLTAYAAYQYDKHYNNHYITTYAALSVAFVFYIANIIGAVKTADYYNMKHRLEYKNGFINGIFSIELN